MRLENELDIKYFGNIERFLIGRNKGKYILICEQRVYGIGDDYLELFRKYFGDVKNKTILIRKIGEE